MNTIKNHIFFKIICFVLIVTFISLDISYAYPHEHTAQNSTVAPPSVFQAQLITAHAEAFQRSMLADGNLLGTVCSIGKFLLEDGLKLSYLARVLCEELGDAAKYVDLSKVSVTIMHNGKLEKLDPSLLVDTPQSAVVLIPYNKDGKKGIIEIALKNNPFIDKLVGYQWVVSDKYVIKDLPENYKGPALRPAPEVKIEAPVQPTISEPIAQVETSLTKTEKAFGVTSRILNIRAIILSSLYSVDPFAAVFGIAALNSAFSVVKDLIFASPIIAMAAGIGIGFALYLFVWRVRSPVNWYLFRARFTRNKPAIMKALLEIGAPAVPILIKALDSGSAAVRWWALAAMGNIGPVTPEVVPALIKASGDGVQKVRWTAIFILGSIGPITPEVVPALVEALGDSDSGVRSIAAYGLIEIADERLSLMKDYLHLVSITPEGGNEYYRALDDDDINYIVDRLENNRSIEGRYIPHIPDSNSIARLILNTDAPAAPTVKEKIDANATPDDASIFQISQLFEIVESSLNSRRARFIEAGNRLIALTIAKGTSGIAAGIGNLDQRMATIEIIKKIGLTMAIIDGSKRSGTIPEVKTTIESLRSNLDQFEADALVGSLIVLARKAKRENQKLIIGLETDWIPGINAKSSYQKQAIFALMKEMGAIGDTLKSMGLDNVEIIRGSGKELSDALLDKAGNTHTNLRNIVVMASSNTINSDNFAALRDADENDRPFLAGIDPMELIKFYSEHGESTSNQLYIRLTQLLYLTLELAEGREPPLMPMIVSYDRKMRTVIFLPRVEPADYEALKKKYTAEKTALVAA